MDPFSIIADVVTVGTLVFGVYQYRSEKRRERKHATMHAYQMLQKEAFDVFNKWSPREIEEACNARQSDAYKELSVALAKIEFFCVGLNQRVYDFNIFYEITHGYFDEGGTLYNRVMPLLESKLRFATEDYFKNLHVVLKKMEKRRRRLIRKDKNIYNDKAID